MSAIVGSENDRHLNLLEVCIVHRDRIWPSILSEEFSSRVAESTRLILVKDGFGGDLGALDRRTDERRKATEI
jgi:hypothetical protein